MQLIIGDYRITSDDRCFVVEERKVSGENAKEPGVEYWGNACYPTTLQQACMTVLRREIGKSEACDIGQVIAAVERAERTIVQALEGVGR